MKDLLFGTRFLRATWGLSLTLPITATIGYSIYKGDPRPFLVWLPICLVFGVFFPPYIASIRYWYRYYYVRRGIVSALLGSIVAIFLTYMSVLYMSPALFEEDKKNTLPCRYCGKDVLMTYKLNLDERHRKCPHCKRNIPVVLAEPGGSAGSGTESPDADDDPVAALHRLVILKEKGVVSDKEFEARKAKIMERW